MRKQKRIESVSVVDQVCDAIKELIIETPYHPGDKLPSEGEIAEAYGVNKLSVRMALQKLTTLGVVDKRNGEGSFVKEFSLSPLFSEAVDFYKKGVRLQDVQELRQLLEGDSAFKAAFQATEEEKQVLKERLNDYNEQMAKMKALRSNERFSDMLEADTAFHRQIVHMSHNQVYEDVYTLVIKLVEDHIISLLMAREDALRNMEGAHDIHNELCRCICEGNGEEARRISCRIVDAQEEIVVPQAE
ncbi:MAG: FadR family transcriptional regulator [Clostridia bacterium]|nr:FadR family transcriptional regulator [Clostridia bacterium]MBQ6426684.1 FadR family transcriptional regulator [Clostridia bacterium]MBR0445400.1 FadR family transcriptional regulator [Clostridia bacterium]